jgi:hypothetical protein
MNSKPPENPGSGCCCGSDPFAALPPELRPVNTQSGKKPVLRKATCPACGLTFRTNRSTDLCVACEKKGLTIDSGG